MNFISATCGIILALSWISTQCMDIDSINITNCNGAQFTITINTAQIIMPTYKFVAGSEHFNEQSITFNHPHTFLTQNAIQKLAILVTNPTTFSVSDADEFESLYKAADFLCSEPCVFKRLFYFIKQQYPTMILDRFDISDERSYSIAELLEEPFFDPAKVVRKLFRIKTDIGFRFRDEDEIKKELNPQLIDKNELHLNLSECNISSLQGLEQLVQVTGIKAKKIKYISLNNNILQTLDLDLLRSTFANVYRIRAKNNPLQEIISKIFQNNTITLNLKNSRFKNLPKIHGHFPITKLRDCTSLCSRDRYHSRTRNEGRNKTLGIGLTLAYSILAWQAVEMALNKYSTGSFINNNANLWAKMAVKCAWMVLPSIAYGWHSNEWIQWSPKYIISRKKRPYSEILCEVAEDAAHISYDLIVFPYLMIKNGFKKDS